MRVSAGGLESGFEGLLSDGVADPRRSQPEFSLLVGDEPSCSQSIASKTLTIVISENHDLACFSTTQGGTEEDVYDPGTARSHLPTIDCSGKSLWCLEAYLTWRFKRQSTSFW